MATTETTTLGMLTTDDLAALRAVSDISFHHYQGAGRIVAYVRNYGLEKIYTMRQQRLFPEATDHDRSRNINVSSGIRSWEKTPEDSEPAAFHSNYQRDTWRTLTTFMRVGDALSLEWTASNNNENDQRIGWHRDELRLVIKRGKNTHVFLIDARTGPDNSARMVRPHGH